MQIPGNTKTFEGELATFWLDDSGILCAVAKNTPRTLERQKENYALIRQITGNKKVCLLSDTSSGNAQTRETREYTAAELPNMFKAMAIVSNSAVGKMIANLFLAIKNRPIPIKMFNTEQEAKEWLKQYL